MIYFATAMGFVIGFMLASAFASGKIEDAWYEGYDKGVGIKQKENIK